MQDEIRFSEYTAYSKGNDKYDIYFRGKLVGLSVSDVLVTILVSHFSYTDAAKRIGLKNLI